VSTPIPFVRPEATTWSIEDILRRTRTGQLYIPAFQRSFRWGTDDVRDLFDSIYRGYPIGDLLVWETERTEGATTTFGAVSFEPAKGRGFVIIDGQQRITSLVSVLLGETFTDTRFRLFFDLDSGKFVHARGRESLPTTWLPLPEVADTVRFLEWLQSRKLSSEQIANANYLVRALRDYRIPVYIVYTQDEKQIREIFERLNTTGKRLTAPEIFAALQRGRHGTDLRELALRLRDLEFGALEEDWLLKAVAAVLGVDVTRKLGEVLRSIKPENVGTGITDTERAIRSVVKFLREDVGIPHVELLPYRFPLVPLTKLFHLIPDPSSDSRHMLAAWVWRGAWSKQHSRSDAPTIRAALQHITKNEIETVSRLLSTTPAPGEPFKLQKHDFRAAGTKLACAALASLKPRHLETREGVIDVASLLNEHGAEALQFIIRSAAVNDSSGTENRLFHPTFHTPVRDLLLRATPDVLRTHCIGRDARHSLAVGNDREFFISRRESLQDFVRNFLVERVALEMTEQ